MKTLFDITKIVWETPATRPGLYNWDEIAALEEESTHMTDTQPEAAAPAPANTTLPGGEMAKAYSHESVEGRWYDWWVSQGYFTPDRDPAKTPFTITMPPPNVTGELHLGHALTATIEDIMIRWKRMQGYNALWLPGFDHAGIAGQYVVEKELARRDLTRHDIGREAFLEHAWTWMHKYIPIISSQFRRLGASCDWTRVRFTMDPGPARAVRVVFKHLYDKGLIYQGERIINWCPRCMTSLSDLEVENEETPGFLWTISYPLADGSGAIQVATTRPETMLGDTAVAVHPDDPRWKSYIGKQATLPLTGRTIPIIADDAIELGFGTGAVKITPGHDPLDFEIGQRHGLPSINLMNQDATLNGNAPVAYQGLKPHAAREAVLEALVQQGLLIKTEPHTHMVPHCERCNTVLEPLISKQWFVRIQPLAEPAIAAAQDGRVSFVPERFNKTYMHWMENIRDWNISRQLWWGHRIPVWTCANGHEWASAEEPETVTACPTCNSTEIQQDTDVLDTWFSSGLWPFTTLGWPEKTPDYEYFYPTNVMETGYDILFFWVARMLMQGIENTGEVPFSTVYLHGLVRDETGRKMSKSLGNTVNPLQAADKYGTDALRFNLATGSTPGNDMKFSESRLEGMQRFANKLWNATRFIVFEAATGQRRLPADESRAPISLPPSERWTLADRWIISRQHTLAADVQRLMEDYNFGEAGRLIYDFIWGEFCDWYLEWAKGPLNGQDAQAKADTLAVMRWTLDRALRLLHPYMPFVTEELWQNLRGRPAEATLPPADQSICVAAWPTPDEAPFDLEAERDFGLLMSLITAIRNARAEAIKDAPEGQKADLARKRIPAYIGAGEETGLLTGHADLIARLAGLEAAGLRIAETMPAEGTAKGITPLVVEDLAVALPLTTLVDPGAVRDRLAAEATQTEAEIGRIETLLGNENFVSKARPDVVAAQHEKLAAARDRLAALQARLAALAG